MKCYGFDVGDDNRDRDGHVSCIGHIKLGNYGFHQFNMILILMSLYELYLEAIS